MGAAVAGFGIVLAALIVFWLLARWDARAMMGDQHLTDVVRQVDARQGCRKSAERILETANEAEGRCHGRGSRERIVLLAPPAEISQQMDLDVRLNLDWLRREGQDVGVEVKDGR